MDPKRQCVLTRANYSVIKMRGVYAKWAAMHGINYNQVLVLYTIRESGFCTQKQVCSNFLLPPQTIHNVISAMRKDGLLRISPENCTGREKAFVLTEKGAEYAAPFMDELSRIEERAIDMLGQYKLEMMAQLVEEYTAALAAATQYEGAEK